MRLDLNSPVRCVDGPAGELADVVVDPVRRRVTHLVVQPHHRHALARLVPIELVGDRDGSPGELVLRCTAAGLRELELVQEFADIGLGERVVHDRDRDVGVEDVLGPPSYGYSEIDPYVAGDPHVWVSYDLVPRGEIELRRASPVWSADGRRLAHVKGLLLDGDDRITGVVIERGHLWARRQVTVPLDAVARIETDAVTLGLGRDELAALPPSGDSG